MSADGWTGIDSSLLLHGSGASMSFDGYFYPRVDVDTGSQQPLQQAQSLIARGSETVRASGLRVWAAI